MSEFKLLLDNVDKLQELGFKSEFDISNYLLSEDEVMKKILISKNPNMSTEDVDMIVDSEQVSLDKLNKEISTNLNNGKLSDKEEKLISDKEERIKVLKKIYKDKLTELKSQAKDIIKEIKMVIYNLIREVKILVKKSITSFMQTSSSISSIAIITTAPPWNIPLAISYTMSIIDLILGLISQIKSIIPFTKSLDKLHFVMNSKNTSIVSKVINTNIEIVLGLWSKLDILDSFIKSLLDSILKLINGSNKSKIFKKATRKLKKLGYFNSDNKTYRIDGILYRANNEDDSSEVKEILDVFIVNGLNVTDYRDKIDEDGLRELNDSVNNDKNIQIPKDLNESYFYLYDINLPNGTILYNQTESDLEELKQTYKIVIDKIQDLNQF